MADASDAEDLKAFIPIVRALKSAFDDPKYSDLTIECGDRRWQVHKSVICTRVPFFAKACDGDWKEANSNTITLPDDHPSVVHTMLWYLYSGKYDQSGAGAEGSMEGPVFSLHVHTIADKYDIQGLADVAKSIFETRVRQEWNGSGFADAAALVFTDTTLPEHFCKTVLSIATEHAEELSAGHNGAYFRETAQKIPALGAALWAEVIKAKNAEPKAKQYRCPNKCGTTKFVSQLAVPGASSAYCEGCRSSFLVSGWLRSEV